MTSLVGTVVFALTNCCLTVDDVFRASGDGSSRVPSTLSRTSAGLVGLIGELGYRAREEDELHARVLPFLYSSNDRRFCEWEELRLNLFAGNEADHPARRRDGCDISAAKLAAFRRAFSLDPLRWFSDFAVELHCFPYDAPYRRLERLVQIWNAVGTIDKLFFVGGWGLWV